MFLFKLFKSILNKDVLEINNYGKHLRDFTYINDVKKILISILNKNLLNIKFTIYAQTSQFHCFKY